MMGFLRRFAQFWIDFIVGDAWEVALGLLIGLIAIATVGDAWGGRQALGFALVATVLGVTWLALLRTTSGTRRASSRE